MMECKAALTEANGDMEEAITLLRKRGLARPPSAPAARPAQGAIGSYIHMGGKIGVLVEVNCESDFVARTDDFNNLVKEVGMHIAAAVPRWVRREDVPAEEVEKESAIYRAQMEKENKPAHVIDKIIEGKLGSFYSQFVLLDQPSIRDDKMTSSSSSRRRARRPARTSQVSRFVRFRVGEAASLARYHGTARHPLAGHPEASLSRVEFCTPAHGPAKQTTVPTCAERGQRLTLNPI